MPNNETPADEMIEGHAEHLPDVAAPHPGEFAAGFEPPKGDEKPLPPPPAPKKTIEQWAEAKGHIMPGWDPENRYVSRSSDPRHRIFAPADFNVAKHLRGWPMGAEVTEADYDAAIHEAQNLLAQ